MEEFFDIENDPEGSLEDWFCFMYLLMLAFGPSASLRTYAGANNVELILA